MSLFKQIQILITVLLLATLIIVMKIDFDKAREFTSRQLFNNGKNIANLLALSLSSHPSDKVFMESSINAMFDGGYFEEILLTNGDGDVLFKKNETLVVEGVPQIFIDLVNLEIPVAEAQVIAGWTLIGTLHVKPHSGPSYIKLWESFKDLCLLFIILGTVTITVSYVILRLLLVSLVAIQHQAEAISDNQFIINESVPGTPELKKVVLAMNTMVEKVQLIYNRQLEYLKNYQALNFKDSNTGLNNRKFLVKQLIHFLESDTENAHGHMFILSLAGMESINISVCHPVLDTFFKDLAEILNSETLTLKDAVTARLPRHEYAVVLPNCDSDDGMAIAKAVMGRILDLLAGKTDLLGVIHVYGGFGAYGHGDDLKNVLSKTDYALSVAKSGPSGTIEAFQEESNQPVLGKFEWKTLIEDALSQGRFVLTAQPVLSESKELHREIYVNMVDPQGVVQRASYFMPMVITLGLANRLDHYVLENSAAFLAQNQEHVLAINITSEFCTDRVSFMWFRQFLVASRFIKDNIVFEIHENTVIQHPDICLDIAGLLKGMGYKFGIDQFTMNDLSLDLLKNLNPHYIKVEYSYLHDMDNQKDAQTALSALMTITDSLDIRLIAVKIENDEQRQSLSAKHITYFQGRGVADISPLTDKHEL
ncbi:MAG: EAL domain-containing protein [Proteobacteria bacterium]|nr:EAL domain-containing protein [Pseudomonadota bacterium]